MDAAPQADSPELLDRARAGELAAFNTLVLRHQDAAYSLALRFLGAQQPAEDVTQDAFLRAYQNISKFRGERFRAWLLTIVANAARDELRRRSRRPQRSLDQARDDPDMPDIDPIERDPGPETVLLTSELRGDLERALRMLPEDQRLIVLLSDVHGLSYPEVAEAASIPVGTVKSRLSRARARLREVLTASGELITTDERLGDAR